MLTPAARREPDTFFDIPRAYRDFDRAAAIEALEATTLQLYSGPVGVTGA